MEKIIVAIRTLNDNLKIVATQVEELEKRIDTIEARIDGIGSSLNDSIHKLADDTEARVAELTARVYSLENAGPEETAVVDDIGDALDDILGSTVVEASGEEAATVVEASGEEAATVVEASGEEAATVVEASTMCPNVDDFIAECLGQTTPTPAPAKTKTKTKALANSAVQKRAFARQYMVEHGAKVEDLRSPAKIEEVMTTAEFQAWVASR